MASLIVAGNTSGTVTLQAPDVSGSTVLTLPTTSGTIVTTGGGASVPFAAGSAASPSITFTGDTNTGIFSPGADTIGFAEGGVEAMRITSAGFVGIGETNPNTILHANGDIRSTNAASNFSRLSFGQFGSSGTSYTFVQGDARDTGYMAFYTNVTEQMRINSSGNVGIGTASPSYPLQVGRTVSAGALSSGGNFNVSYTDGNTSLGFRSTNSDSVFAAFAGSTNIIFAGWNGSTNLERMRIDASSNLQFNSGYGSVATAYGCRAWVNFNGTGTVAIRASGNVSSITDNGTGNYTVNFANAMPDANYTMNVTSNFSGSGTGLTVVGTAGNISTGNAVVFVNNSSSGASLDAIAVNVAVFR